MMRRILALNGLAILAVIINHAARWGYIAMFYWADRYRGVAVPDFSQMGSPAYYALVTARQVTIFAVPAFLFASGIFASYAARSSRGQNTWRLMRNRILQLLVPYLIWTGFILVSDALQGDVYTAGQYAEKVLLGLAYGGYYFVPLLIQYYLLTPLLVPLGRQRPARMLWAAALIQLAVYGLGYLEVFGVVLPTWLVYLTREWSFLRWPFYFTLGLAAGFNSAALRDLLTRWRKALLAALLVFTVLAVVEPEVIFQLAGRDMRAVPTTFSTGIYALLVILVYLAYDQLRLPYKKGLSTLGSKSYGVYLLHGKTIEFSARLIYHFLPALLAFQALLQPLLILAGLVIPLLLMGITLRTPAKRSYRYLFG